MTNGFAGRRCILLGGGGFIGANLCQQLVSGGAEVVIVSPQAVAEDALAGATWIRATLDQTDSYETSIRQGDYVFHMVSTTVPATSNANPITDISNNVLTTLKLLEILRQRQIARLVFLSSGGTVYGKDVPIPTPEDAANEPIAIWGDGNVVRDYIYVSDLIEAIQSAALYENAKAPRLYNIGSGEGRSIRQILDTVQAIRGKPLEVVFEAGRMTDVPVSILEIKRAKQHLNWIPTKTWEHALAETYAWTARYNQIN